MKKMLSFVPLAVGISAALIYLFNIMQLKMIGNSITLVSALTTLKIYLYISIISFIIYFIIKIIIVINYRKKTKMLMESDSTYEPFEKVIVENKNDIYIPNHDYVPVYKKEEVKECFNCKKIINKKDKYCPNCGSNQKDRIKIINPFIKNIISVIEIVILILVLYFLVNLLFDFKEKQDPTFKSPFKISMTK